jgi:hypothetical protein
MTPAAAARPLPAPWSVQLIEALPLPPVWIGVGVATAVLAVYLGVELVSGNVARVLAGDQHFAMHFRISFINALMLGFLPTAQVYLSRWTPLHLEQLRPLLARSSEPWSDSLTAPARRTAGVMGSATLVLLFLVIPVGTVPLTREYWIFEHAWDWVMLVPIGWLAGRLVYAMIRESVYFSRLSPRIEQIDLLDSSPLLPFVSQGLKSALLVVVLLSIFMGLVGVLIISPVASVITALGMVGVATLALLLPVRGVHLRIRAEKRVKLAAVRTQIRAAEGAAMESDADGVRAAARLPGLLALESRIREVREWPFDTPSLARFALYVTLGVGSWLGAAAVERLLDFALA